MKENIDHNSALEGRNKSRLPRFSKDEIEFVKGNLVYIYSSLVPYAVGHEWAPTLSHISYSSHIYSSHW